MARRGWLGVLLALTVGCGTTSKAQLTQSPPTANPPGTHIRENPSEWDARLQEYLRRRPVEEDSVRAEAMAHVQLARDYQAAGRLTRAIETCQKALEIWPDCPEANELLIELKTVNRKP